MTSTQTDDVLVTCPRCSPSVHPGAGLRLPAHCARAHFAALVSASRAAVLKASRIAASDLFEAFRGHPANRRPPVLRIERVMSANPTLCMRSRDAGHGSVEVSTRDRGDDTRRRRFLAGLAVFTWRQRGRLPLLVAAPARSRRIAQLEPRSVGALCPRPFPPAAHLDPPTSLGRLFDAARATLAPMTTATRNSPRAAPRARPSIESRRTTQAGSDRLTRPPICRSAPPAVPAPLVQAPASSSSAGASVPPATLDMEVDIFAALALRDHIAGRESPTRAFMSSLRSSVRAALIRATPPRMHACTAGGPRISATPAAFSHHYTSRDDFISNS